jgi:hypothetical protein
MKNSGIILFILGIFCFILSSPVWAEFKFTPSISIREEYDDNIFLTANNEKEDFITTITPGMSLGYDSERLRLSLNYSFIAYMYMHHSSENEISHNAQFDSTLTVLRDFLFLKVTDAYSRVTIDQRRQVVQDNRFVNATDSNHFTVNPYLEYPLSGTLKVKTGYTYENIWYKSDEGDDEETHLMTAGVIKEFSQKFTTSLFYTYSIHDLKTGGDLNDYDRQDVTFGANYQLTQKLSLNGSFGHAWLDYKESGNHDSDTWDANAQYQITEAISFQVGYAKNFASSVDAGVSETETVFASLTRQGTIAMSLRAFKKDETYLEEDRKDESTGVAASASYPITPNLTGRITGLYTYDKFLPEEEKVNRYGAGISFDYALRLVTISLGYSYDLSNSNIETNDYRDNRAWVEARITL